MTLRASALALAVAALLSMGGCAADVGTGIAELGTGEWRFEALGLASEAPDVELIRGAQGGVHIWTSVRVVGLVPDRVTMELTTEPVDGSLPPEHSVVEVDLDDPGEEIAGMHELIGWPAVVSRPGCIVDRDLRLSITLTDQDGATAYDERIVVPRGTDMPACE